MKKKVRIYKAPDGNGKYINKTAKFLGKMALGGQPTIDEVSYPGSQVETQASSEEELMQQVYQDISNDVPYEAIVAKLVNANNLDPVAADQFVQQVYSIIENKIDQEKSDEAEDEEETKEAIIADVEQTVNNPSKPMSKIEGHNDLAMEDTDEDLTDIEDEDMLKYGGTPRFDYGGEQDYIEAMNNDQTNWPESETPIIYPDVSEYLPYDMSDYLGEEISNEAWQQPEEFKLGGFKTKKGYVNSVAKLVKKAMGGADNEQDTKASDADPRGDDLRKNRLDAFVSAVKNEGNISIAKEEAKKEFEEMQAMHDQMMMQNSGLQNFIPADYNSMNEMQFGGQQRRAMRRMNRALRHIPYGIPGMAAPITKFDVRRSGIFGGPKEYTIEFGQSPLMQLAGNPMLSHAYGYGYRTKTTKTPGKLITEKVRNTINNKSTKEIANATNSEAAAKSAWDLDQNLIPDNIQSNIIKSKAKSELPAITPANNSVEDIFRKDPPRVGETNSGYLLRTTGNPGFYNNTDVWNGSEFIKLKEEGGSINNPMPDQFGNLQRFIGGGFDPSQNDIDDVYSKDTSDAYFQHGGLTKYAGDEEGSETDENENFEYTVSGPNTGNKSSAYDLYKQQLGNAYGMSLRPDISAQEMFEMQQNLPMNKQRFNYNQGMGNMNYSRGYNYGYDYNTPFGNMMRTYFPANLPRRYGYTQMMRGPYNRNTGQQFMGVPGFNPYAQIQSITGKGRKFTVNYNNNPSGKPEDRKLAYMQPGTYGQPSGGKMKTQEKTNLSTNPQSQKPGSIYSNTDGLSLGSKMAIRRGERKTAREVKRGMEEFPENPNYVSPKGDMPQVKPTTTQQPQGPFPTAIFNVGKAIGNKQKQYGGDLQRFIPQALYGNETPVTNDDNPVVGEIPKMKMQSSKDAAKDLMMSSRKKLEGEANYQPDEYSVDYKNKNMWDVDGEALALLSTAGIEGVAGLLNRLPYNNNEAKLYNNYNSNNLFATKVRKDVGDTSVNEGFYRPNEAGAMRTSRSAQYGGSSNYSEGDVVDMTEAEIAEFLANGGQLEYLNY